MSRNAEFWPNGARLAVTVSRQFEAGGQRISGAPGPVTEPIKPGYPDLPQNSFYEYGVTLELLQELGFTYHIDDLSADEPFIQEVSGAPFVTVPYTVHMNDIASFDFAAFSPADYEQQLRDEFEPLYEEGRGRRRMMSMSLHDRISG